MADSTTAATPITDATVTVEQLLELVVRRHEKYAQFRKPGEPVTRAYVTLNFVGLSDPANRYECEFTLGNGHIIALRAETLAEAVADALRYMVATYGPY